MCGQRVPVEWEADGSAISATASVVAVYGPHGCEADYQPCERPAAPERAPEATQPLPPRTTGPRAAKGEREAQVLRAMRAGASTVREVAEALGCSYATARGAMGRLQRRLAVRQWAGGGPGQTARWEVVGDPIPADPGGRPSYVWPDVREELYRGPRTTRQLAAMTGHAPRAIWNSLRHHRQEGRVTSQRLADQCVWWLKR